MLLRSPPRHHRHRVAQVAEGQVGALQRLSLPPVGWDDGDGDARHTQSGLVLSPHTVEVREITGLLRY
jgi:hypothetical protein